MGPRRREPARRRCRGAQGTSWCPGWRPFPAGSRTEPSLGSAGRCDSAHGSGSGGYSSHSRCSPSDARRRPSKLARSPQFQSAVVNALRTGANKLSHARLKRLAPRFAGLVRPAGMTAALTPADTLSLIKAVAPLVRPVTIRPAVARKAVKAAVSLISSRWAIAVPPGKTRTLPLRFALPPGKPIAALERDARRVPGPDRDGARRDREGARARARSRSNLPRS